MPTLRERLLGQSSPTPRYGAGTLRERLLGTGIRRVPSAASQDTIFSGNFLEDVIDVLNTITGQYPLVGLAHAAQHQEEAGQGYSLKGLWEGVKSGVKGRASWRDFLKDHELFGVSLKGKPEWVSTAVGTVLDAFVDPGDMLIGPAVGLAGKGIAKGSKALGLTDAIRSTKAPERLLKWVAERYTHSTLKGGTIGEVVDTLASDTKLLRRLWKMEDAKLRDASPILEAAQPVANRTAKWSRPLQELMYQYISEPGSVKPSVLEAVEKQLKAEGVKDIAKAKAKFLDDAAEVRKFEALSLTKKQEAGFLPQTRYNPDYLRRSYLMYDDMAEWNKRLAAMPPEQSERVYQTIRNFGIEPELESGTIVKGFRRIGSGESISPEEMGSILERHVIPPAVREAMGEVKNVHYAVVKGAKADASLIAKKKFLEGVAEDFSKDFYPRGYVPGGASEPTSMAHEIWRKAREAGYVQMPDTEAWGALRGKFVPEVVAKYLTLPRVQKGGFLQAAIGLWKAGKVVWNPATHVRNSLTNDLLADWGTGLTPLTPRWWHYKTQAARALIQHNDDFKEAQQAGTFLTATFRATELPAMLREGALSEGKYKGLIGWLKAIGKKPGDLYEFEEQLGKMTVYLAERDRLIKAGMAVEQAMKTAADTADEWLINYRHVPRWVDLIRSGQGPLGVLGTVPFITFQYKVTPLVGKAMLNNPTRITKYFKLGRGVEALSEPDETAAEKRVMPPWMKEGIWVKLPMKDKYNRSLYLDATYLVPLADLSGSRIVGPGGAPAIVSTPFVDLYQDLVRNQSRFTGKPLWGAGMTKGEVARAIGEYLGSQLLPSLAPGGYGFRNIRDAVAKKPDWLGRTRTLDQVLAAQLLGLKTRPVNYAEEAMSRAKEFEDELNAIKFQLRKRLADPAISEEQKQRAWEKSVEMMNELLAEMNEVLGGNR